MSSFYQEKEIELISNPCDLISLIEYAIVFVHKVAVLKGGK